MPVSNLWGRLFDGNRLGLWFSAFLLFASMATVWAVSSPLASVPDEPAHIVKAAGVVRGEPFGQRTVTPEGITIWSYSVPEAYAEIQDLACNKFNAAEPVSACSISLNEPEGSLFTANTGAGGYNPVYYFLVGWPSLLLPGLQGILGMRLVSGVLASLFLASTVWAASWVRNRGIVSLVAVAVATPSVIFYAGGVNPQGMEVAALAAFTSAYLVALETRARGRLLWGLCAVMMVSGALGVQARNLAWVWLGAIVLVGIIWAGWRRWWRFVRQPLVLGAVAIVLIGVVANLVIMVSVSALDGGGQFWGAGMSQLNGFVFMLWRFAEFFTSMFALFGWMDVDGRWAVLIYVAFTLTLIVGALLARVPGRKRGALIVSLVLWWVLPALVQSMTVTEFGFIWQGRYGLPLWVLTMFVAALALSRSFENIPGWLKSRIVIVSAVLLGFSHVTALIANLQRQYLGVQEPFSRLLSFQGAQDLSYDLPPLMGPAGWILMMTLSSSLLALLAQKTACPPLRRRNELQGSPERKS